MINYYIHIGTSVAVFAAERSTGPVKKLYFLRAKVNSVEHIFPIKEGEKVEYKYTWKANGAVKIRAIKAVFEHLIESAVQLV